MVKVCDHTSVGMLIWRDDRLLLIERKKGVLGFAPPAGHVDGFGSHEEAARQEVSEEVGLTVTGVELLTEGRKENKCRRDDGSWHFWKIYQVDTTGELVRSEEETKQAGFYTRDQVSELAQRTEAYQRGEIDETTWAMSPGIEPVWYEWLKALKVI
jgi:8-oxo-dGTP pyrophosphatase MutT (NUDIX family)